MFRPPSKTTDKKRFGDNIFKKNKTFTKTILLFVRTIIIFLSVVHHALCMMRVPRYTTPSFCGRNRGKTVWRVGFIYSSLASIARESGDRLGRTRVGFGTRENQVAGRCGTVQTTVTTEIDSIIILLWRTDENSPRDGRTVR